ncbi:IS3 family transposase, partial [bacterium]|nr:IS3 family transposase [bacterium]
DPSSGSRRLRDRLRNEGFKVNRKKIQRLMKVLGIEAIMPKRRTSIPSSNGHKYPYLLRNLKVNKPNMVWCTDISYLRMSNGFMYIVAIMDWYSRNILSWKISNSMTTSFCVEALKEAMEVYGKPEIFNTDQGSQFTSSSFTAVLEANEIKISMDIRGRWLDNVFIERF